MGTHSLVPRATDTNTQISDIQAHAIDTDFPKDEFLLTCMCTFNSLKIKFAYMVFLINDKEKILGWTQPADWADCFLSNFSEKNLAF